MLRFRHSQGKTLSYQGPCLWMDWSGINGPPPRAQRTNIAPVPLELVGQFHRVLSPSHVSIFKCSLVRVRAGEWKLHHSRRAD